MGAALPLGWVATAHPFRAAGPMAVPGPDLDRVFVRPEGEAGVAAARLAVTLLRAGPTGRSCRPTQLPAIVRLGRFSAAAT